MPAEVLPCCLFTIRVLLERAHAVNMMEQGWTWGPGCTVPGVFFSKIPETFRDESVMPSGGWEGTGLHSAS